MPSLIFVFLLPSAPCAHVFEVVSSRDVSKLCPQSCGEHPSSQGLRETARSRHITSLPLLALKSVVSSCSLDCSFLLILFRHYQIIHVLCSAFSFPVFGFLGFFSYGGKVLSGNETTCTPEADSP